MRVKEGDFVFDARPLTRATEGSIGESVLASMKSTAVFINVGRAGTVREEAMYRHLVAHPDFRAALDVWWHEDFASGRLGNRFPFAGLPNLVGTPHSAGFGPGVETYVLRARARQPRKILWWRRAALRGRPSRVRTALTEHPETAGPTDARVGASFYRIRSREKEPMIQRPVRRWHSTQSRGLDASEPFHREERLIAFLPDKRSPRPFGRASSRPGPG